MLYFIALIAANELFQVIPRKPVQIRTRLLPLDSPEYRRIEKPRLSRSLVYRFTDWIVDFLLERSGVGKKKKRKKGRRKKRKKRKE
jgi:hypothetical protein